jgi:hypothetical protein
MDHHGSRSDLDRDTISERVLRQRVNAKTNIMATTPIANLLTKAECDLSVADDTASEALSQTVKLLKAAIPFLLPVRIVTGHLSPLEIAREDSREPYTQILFEWFTEFASNPRWEIDDLTDFISLVRHAVADQIAYFLEQRCSAVPLSLRKLRQLECNLCDEVMIHWLSVANVERLFELALRWSTHRLSNDRPSALDELGLTVRSIVDRPEEELVRLQLIERIEAENRQRLADLWKFLRDDPEGVRLEQLVFDATKVYAVTQGEPL